MIIARQTARADDDIQLRHIWRIVHRHRLLMLACFLVVLAIGTVMTLRTVPVYQAATSIRIDEQTSALPALDVLKTLSNGGSEVGTELDMLRSRTLAEEVVDSLGLQVRLAEPRRTLRSAVLSRVRTTRDAAAAEYLFERNPTGTFAVSDVETGAGMGMVAAGGRIVLRGATVDLTPSAGSHETIRVSVQQFAAAVRGVQLAMKVTRPNRESNVVIVRYEDTDRELVRAVPTAIAVRFMIRRRDAQKTEARSTVVFLREQLDTISNQLAGSEDELRKFRESAQVVNLEAEGTAAIGRLAQLQADRSTIEAERAALGRLLDEVRVSAAAQQPGDLSPYRRLVAFPTLLRNVATSQMLASLAKADDELAALLLRRMAEDPDVLTAAARVHDIEQQLSVTAITYQQGLSDQVAALDVTLAQFGRQLELVPAKEVEFARLMRRPKVLDAMFGLLQTRLKEAEIVQAVEDATVSIVDPAITPVLPIKPRVVLSIALAGMLGLVLGFVATYVREHMDRTIHTREDLQEATGIAVLGVIPRIQRASGVRYALGGGSPGRISRRLVASALGSGNTSANSNGNGDGGGYAEPEGAGDVIAAKVSVPASAPRLVASIDSGSPVSEAYRSLRTNILFSRPDAASKLLVITSATSGEGKSTTAANLAVALMQQGLKVLLVDADTRRGLLNVVLGTPREPGLSNVLLGVTTLESAVHHVEIGDEGTLDFLSTGTLPPNPAELLGSTAMQALLDTLRASYDAIILDAPPLTAVTDAAILGMKATGTIVVARAGMTTFDALQHTVEQLHNVRAPMLGAVLNDFDAKRDGGYYGTYDSYQRYYATADLGKK